MQFTNIKVLFGITRKVVFLGYVAAQWWSKNWMSASLWPGKIGGSCLSLLIGMQHPQSLETTFVCKVHCSQPGSQTVWQKFANDCCHIYKCMLQSVSLHQSEQRRIWLNLLYTGFVVRLLPSTFVILQLNCYPGTTTTLFMEEFFHFCFGLRGSGWFLNVSH